MCLRKSQRISFSTVLSIVIAVHAMLPRFASAEEPKEKSSIRIATFNCSLNRNAAGELQQDLQSGTNAQARKVAAILRTVKPDFVLLNEFDYVENGAAIAAFQKNYLDATGDWTTEPPLKFEYAFCHPVNTGVPSGRDLDHDGKMDGFGDAYGFGRFPGQFGMVVLSRYPIAFDSVRTFQKLLWRDLPNSATPAAQTPGAQPWYNDEDLKTLRLSSKSHWDVPITIGQQTLHVLVSHPTPPAFDGPEDRNGRRNHDEIRLWADYISPEHSKWIVDDKGIAGGLLANMPFVIVGDQNADPNDGDSFDNAIHQLLSHPRINATNTPTSAGGVEATKVQGKVNNRHKGDPAQDTSDFSDFSVGNLRADYVLPSNELKVVSTGIFWPATGEPGADLIDCSDHRLVWIDIAID